MDLPWDINIQDFYPELYYVSGKILAICILSDHDIEIIIDIKSEERLDQINLQNLI